MPQLSVDTGTFEQLITGHTGEVTEAAAAVLGMTALAINFSHVERVPRYTPNTRENDAEHSFMLAIMAGELALRLYPHLDSSLVQRYALYHDFIELVTRDVATFAISAEALDAKEQAEHRALNEVVGILPPLAARTLLAYEQQADPESRFVKLVDKLLPLTVDILGPGSQVMHEDYDVTSAAQLDHEQRVVHDRLTARFGQEFPELLDIHQALGGAFLKIFQEAPDQPRLPLSCAAA